MQIIRKTWWNSQIWLCKTQVFDAEGVNVTLEVISRSFGISNIMPFYRGLQKGKNLI